MKKILLALIVLPFFVKAQDDSKNYKIYSTKAAKTTTIEQIITEAKNTDVLFFGEEHNDSVGHQLELLLYKKLAETFQNQVVLSLEMFHTDVQVVLDEYLAGNISEKNFTKEARAWNNYKDYRPLIELAKSKNMKVIGANAAARYSNAVTKNGLAALANFPKASRIYFAPLPIDTLSGRYYEKFVALLGGHSMGGMKVYQSQNFWDATMAHSILTAHKKYKKQLVLHLNGRFHSDEKLGTYAQLKQKAPKLRLLNISCFAADDFENPNWQQYQQLGDYIIVTNPKIKKTF